MKKLTIVCLIPVFIGLLLVNSSLAITLGFGPASQTVLPGDSLDVDIIISGLHSSTPDEIVSVFDLFMTYDASVLSATTVTFGTFLGDPLLFEALVADDLSTPGIVNFTELSFLPDFTLDATQPDTFTLATLSFDAIGLGTSLLDFAPHIIYGHQEVKGLNGNVLPLNVISGSVNVIPEPGTILLLASGLGVIATWSGIAGRRRKKS